VPRRNDAMDYTLTVTDLQEQVDIELSKLLDGLDALPEGLFSWQQHNSDMILLYKNLKWI